MLILKWATMWQPIWGRRSGPGARRPRVSPSDRRWPRGTGGSLGFPRAGGHLPLRLYNTPPPMTPWLIHPSLLLSSLWLSSHVWSHAPQVRGNSTCRKPSRNWISGSSLSSFAALLDRSPDDVHTPYECNPSEALLLRC
jgi:hypothetical protein